MRLFRSIKKGGQLVTSEGLSEDTGVLKYCVGTGRLGSITKCYRLSGIFQVREDKETVKFNLNTRGGSWSS